MRAVVIGSGPAGITAAETLRSMDPTGSVVMLSAEPFAPYSPAAMSDHFLTGREETLYWKGADAASRLGIDERRGAVVAGLDAENREVVLDDASKIPYEGLIIASGSRLHAPLDGSDLPGILDFKSLSMANDLIGRVRRGESSTALIVGSGLIGVELALLLADLGVRVTVVELATRVMPRILDEATAMVVERALVTRGVAVELGVEATGFVGTPDVHAVHLADERVLLADLVIAATGVKPHVEFLRDSPIETSWGVWVNDRLSTSVPGVFAAGDVAEAADWLTGENFVHAIFANAVSQGRLAAANLLGADLRYDGAESMNSIKHLGIPVVALGTFEKPDDILRYEAGPALRTLYLRDGKIVGAQLAGDIRAAGLYRSLMLRRADVGRYGRGLVTPSFSTATVVYSASGTGH